MPVPRRLKQGEEDVVVDVEDAGHIDYRPLDASPGYEGLAFRGRNNVEHGLGQNADFTPSAFLVKHLEITPFGLCAVRKYDLVFTNSTR